MTVTFSHHPYALCNPGCRPDRDESACDWMTILCSFPLGDSVRWETRVKNDHHGKVYDLPVLLCGSEEDVKEWCHPGLLLPEFLRPNITKDCVVSRSASCACTMAATPCGTGMCYQGSLLPLHFIRGLERNHGDANKGLEEGSEQDAVWLMQKGRERKRQRSPTPRRRRIPARGRVSFEPRQRQTWRSTWTQRPEHPTCSTSWANLPWRRNHGARAHSRPARPSRCHGEEREEDDVEEVEVEPESHPNASSSNMASAPPLPPFEEGIRTWGELIGILDPMDEAEQIIDPLTRRGWTAYEGWGLKNGPSWPSNLYASWLSCVPRSCECYKWWNRTTSPS